MPASVNANNAYSTLAANITNVATSFTVLDGSAFPVVLPGDWSFVTFQDTANHIEIMKITAHGAASNSFSCVRAQEGTIARAWLLGDIVECRFTAGTVVTLDAVQTLTNKTIPSPAISFADGTLALPGIRWTNEPTMGFVRIAANVMAASINSQNVMQWQPSGVIINTGYLYMTNNGVITFPNSVGANWGALYGSTSNDLFVGGGGWVNTYVCGGGLGNLRVHAGGVAMSGNVSGITPTMVGLSEVANARQVYNLYGPGGSVVYIGFSGTLNLQVDSTYFGNTWPIQISGNAATATSATTASNANAVNGITGWNYSAVGYSPNYVWATDGATNNQFLVSPSILGVGSANYANTAGSAAYATTAGSVSGGGGGVVSTINGQAGAINITAGGGIAVDTYGTTIVISRSVGSNSSIHPDSEITMADGSKKWLRDIRVGDSVWGGAGPAEVLGIWTNILQERSLWEVVTDAGAVVCTPGHLFPVMVGGAEVWGSPVPEMYWANSHGRKRSVKGKFGLIDTLSLVVGDDETVHTLTKGMLIRHVSGRWVAVTGLREVSVHQPEYDRETKRSAATRITENQQVMALHLQGSKMFYADGFAVGTLA